MHQTTRNKNQPRHFEGICGHVLNSHPYWGSRRMMAMICRGLCQAGTQQGSFPRCCWNARLGTSQSTCYMTLRPLLREGQAAVAAIKRILTQFSPPCPADKCNDSSHLRTSTDASALPETGTLVLLVSKPGPRCPKHKSSLGSVGAE